MPKRMKRIILTQPLGLADAQLEALGDLGDVTAYDAIAKDAKEWLGRVKGADIVYTNHHWFDE